MSLEYSDQLAEVICVKTWLQKTTKTVLPPDLCDVSQVCPTRLHLLVSKLLWETSAVGYMIQG